MAPQEFTKKHALGQNFLINRGVIDASLQRAALSADDTVLEIGPGQGILTRELIKSGAGHVHAVEFDRELAPWLTPLESESFSLHWGDALAVDFTALSPIPTAVVANIPYHITTPLIWRLLSQLAPSGLNQLVLLVQKEAADRLSAPPCTKARYPLGITLEAMGSCKTFMRVSPGSFNPPPKVDSALVHIQIDRNSTLAADRLWRSLLSHSFAQRRKTLIKSASAGGWNRNLLASLLEKMSLLPTARAEELTVSQWLHLAGCLRDCNPTVPGLPYRM